MKIKFIFLLFPELHLLDLAGPEQVISEAIDLGAPFEILFVGLQPDIQSSSGMPIGQLCHYSKVDYASGDFIVIPGMKVAYLNKISAKPNKELNHWLTLAYEQGVNLVSICVGAFILGHAGLLNNKACTTHFQLLEQFKRRFPFARTKENVLFTEEQRIYTSAGIASGIDLFLYILEQLTSDHLSFTVARNLVVYKRRESTHEQHSFYFQFRDHIHAGIHEAQDYIIAHLDLSVSVSHLAHMANMSERNFSRLFKKETGITVVEYQTKARLEKLKWLIKNSDLTRQQMASYVGLNSTRQVTRLLGMLSENVS